MQQTAITDFAHNVRYARCSCKHSQEMPHVLPGKRKKWAENSAGIFYVCTNSRSG